MKERAGIQSVEVGFALLDVHALMEELTTRGREVGGVTLSGAFLTGGVFSYDGMYLTDLGYAVMANEWIAVINANGGRVPPVDLGPVLGLVAHGGGKAAAQAAGASPGSRVHFGPQAYAALLRAFPARGDR